jgi:hypothetical protein
MQHAIFLENRQMLVVANSFSMAALPIGQILPRAGLSRTFYKDDMLPFLPLNILGC